MDYEKKYKNALEWARQVMHGETGFIRKEVEDVFLELKESKDETIRKTLIEYIKGIKSWNYFLGISKEEMIAWLEKQKPQEQESKQEPKFKVGDWITDGYIYYKITEILDDRYIIESKYDKGGAILFEYENRYHLWTIKDVKDGDVLINWNNTTFIFKAIEDETVKFHVAYNEEWDTIKTPSTKLSHLGLPEPQFEFHPATKEQCDLLFQKMKEAGYEWDAQKKEVKKPTDEVEPKFHEGDWVVNSVCFPMQIASIKDGMYIFTKGDAMSVLFIDGNFHLWSINDANDGDVLIDSYSKDSIIILYKGINKEQSILAHCGWNGYNFSIKTKGLGYGGLDNTNYLPATKEQRDLLFEKMKNAGYEWDAQKKEVKKPTDEVESKFKVGDFITNDYCLGKVIEITNDAYLLDTGQGIPFSCENTHLWTIEDAKDGDVLICEGCEYLLFKSFSNTDGRIKLYCWYNKSTNNFYGSTMNTKLRREANIHPATKEQRDLLFSKMKEAGCEWDSEKKELKKDKKEIRRDEVKKNLQEYRSKTFSMKDLVDSFSAYIDKKCKNGPRRWLDADDKKLVIDAIKNGDWEVIFNLNEKYHE